MKPMLINRGQALPLSDQAIHDLDILNILMKTEEQPDKAACCARIKDFFSSDASELTERGALLTDLAPVRAKDFEKALSYVRSVAEENEKYGRSLTRLDEVLYLTRRAESFISAVDSFSDLLGVLTVTSSRLAALKAFFEALRGSSEPVRHALSEVRAMIRLPACLYLGINVREDGTPQEYSFLGETFEHEPVNSLLSADHHDLPANSLSAEFVYNSRLYGFHLDEAINRTLEKRWKNALPKARKLLLAAPLPFMDELVGLTDELSWCLTGLRLSELYQDLGVSLCRPEPVERAGVSFLIEARDLHYPELCLSLPSAGGNAVSMAQNGIYIITGANHSGTTSYLKIVGQSLILAQLGFFVPAQSFRFVPVTGLHSLFSAGEDDSMDASRMGIEINKISDIAQHALPTDLVFFNEPLTSTNPLEAVSLCADLCRRFIAAGIPMLLVTHLYDVYFLLRAQLPEEQQSQLVSLITESYYDEGQKSMVHAYRLREADPEGNSYARETAVSYGITVDQMLPASLQAAAQQYLDGAHSDSFYEGGKN